MISSNSRRRGHIMASSLLFAVEREQTNGLALFRLLERAGETGLGNNINFA
jgi:hypothetical protein